MADPVDIRVMVPRVRRALEGAGAPQVLTDDAIKDLTADAIAEVILYTGGVFGHELVVTDRDDTTERADRVRHRPRAHPRPSSRSSPRRRRSTTSSTSSRG